MAYFLEFDEQSRVARLVWEGRVTDEVLLEGSAVGTKFLASHPGVRGISDFSKATEFDLSSEVINRLAWAPDQGERGSVVVIVTPQNVAFGLSRMFEMLAERDLSKHHSVRTIEEAYKLLGINDAQFVLISVP